MPLRPVHHPVLGGWNHEAASKMEKFVEKK